MLGRSISRLTLPNRGTIKPPPGTPLLLGHPINEAALLAWLIGEYDQGSSSTTQELGRIIDSGPYHHHGVRSLHFSTTTDNWKPSHHGGVALDFPDAKNLIVAGWRTTVGTTVFDSIPPLATLNTNSHISISLWFKAHNIATDQGLATHRNGDPGWVFAIQGSSKKFWFHSAHAGHDWFGSTVLASEVWYQAGISYGPGRALTFILNGEPDGTATVDEDSGPSAAFTTGSWDLNTFSNTNGFRENLRAWDRVLKPHEWRSLYQEPYIGYAPQSTWPYLRSLGTVTPPPSTSTVQLLPLLGVG